MPKTITIDTLVRGPLLLTRNPDGSVTVEASYGLKAGEQVVSSVNREVTGLLSAAQRNALTDAYNSVYTSVESVELS